jgi:hypothetical protein
VQDAACDGLQILRDELKRQLMQVDSIRVPRYGVLCAERGELRFVSRRLLPKIATNIHVWWDATMRTLPPDTAWLYFSQPMRCPGFMVINYARSGPRTSLRTIGVLSQSITILAEFAKARAIVCQAIHPRLGERIFDRFGYVRHAHHLPGMNFIKRLPAQ